MNATNTIFPSSLTNPNPSFTSPTEAEVPDQYQDAISSREAAQWKAAMVREHDSLMSKETFNLVD